MKPGQTKGDQEIIRAFIGITLPEKMIVHLKDVQANLKAYKFKASWPRPSNMHLTLRFLGDMPGKKSADISECIHKSVADFKKKNIGLPVASEGIGVFPSVRKPKIVWAGIGGETDALKNLHSILSENLERSGFKKEKSRFSPHITLCRLKQRITEKYIAQILKKHGNVKSDVFAVNAVTLFKSQLERTGAVHTELFSERID
jgi:RNA 2',3'-cyclic 3'-phosphodiesterase